MNLFLHKDSLCMIISSSPPVIYDFSTCTSEKLVYQIQDYEWFRPPFFLSQIGDENVWMVFDFISDFPCSGCVDILPTACFFSKGRWNSFRIDCGAYFGVDGPLYRHVSVKSVGSNSKNKVYVTCAVDEDPGIQITGMEYLPYPEVAYYFNAHLEVWAFDASTGDTLSYWNLDDAEPSTSSSIMGDGIEVATTDESGIVGFAISKNGDTSLRALIDPVWYKPVSLEDDSTRASAHPSAVVDHSGNIWVAWDDGKDIYVSSIRISDMEVDDVLTSVESDAEAMFAKPAKFLLAPNFPNPFNPTTTIAFELPRSSDVHLTIYNLAGQQIRTLLDGAMEGGSHKSVWDGKNDLGRDVASGVYLYRLTVDGGKRTETKKMVLIR